MKKARLAFLLGGTGVLIAALTAGTIALRRAPHEKNDMSERQIGLGAGYIQPGDRVKLNVFSEDDSWEVMSLSPNGEVSDNNMFSNPVFLLEENEKEAVWGNPQEGDSQWMISSIKDQIDTELLEAEGDLNREKYANILMPTVKDVDDAEFPYSDKSTLTGDKVFVPSQSEYETLKESGVLDEDKALWSRSSGGDKALFSYLSNGDYVSATDTNAYRNAANADLGKNNVVYTYKEELPELEGGELTKVKKENALTGLVDALTGNDKKDTWNIKLYDDSLNLTYDDALYENGKVSITGLKTNGYLDYESLYDTENENLDLNKNLNTTGLSVMVTNKPYTDEDSEVVYFASADSALESGELNFSLGKEAAKSHVYLIPENETSAGTPVELNLNKIQAKAATLKHEGAGLSGAPLRAGTGYTVDAKAYGNGGGNKDSDGYGVNIGGTVSSSVSVEFGGSATLEATPNKNYKFDGWYSDSALTTKVGTSAKLVLTNVTSAATYYAKFTRTGYDIKTIVNDTSTGYVKGGGTVRADSNLEVTAKPSDGYALETFSLKYAATGEDVNSDAYSQNSDVLTFNGDKLHGDITITATFKKDASAEGTVTVAMVPQIGYVGIKDYDSTDCTADYQFLSSNGVMTYTKAQIQKNSMEFISGYNVGLGDNKNEFSYLPDGLFYYDEENNKWVKPTYVNSKYRIDGQYRWYFAVVDLINLNIDSPYFIMRWHADKHDDPSATPYSYAAITVAEPANAGTTSGDYTSTSAFTANLTATPNEGYMFDHWEWTEGAIIDDGSGISQKESAEKPKKSKDNPLSVSPNGIIIYRAVFTPTTYEVRLAETDPANCGTATGTGTYGKGDNAAVTALPADGYEFESWSYKTADGVTHTFKTPTIEIKDIKEDYNLTLKCKKSGYEVSVGVDPLGNDSTGNYNKAEVTTGLETAETGETKATASVSVQSEGSVKLTATPNTTDGYHFKQWVGSDGTVSAQNPLTMSGIKDDITFVAEFEKQTYTLNVKSDPVDGGKVSAEGTGVTFKDTGTYTVAAGATPKLKVAANTGFTFDYWTNNAGEKFTGSELTLQNVYGDDTYTAHFVKDSLSLSLSISPANNPAASINIGTIDYEVTKPDGSSGGSGSDIKVSTSVNVDSKSNVKLTARPYPGTVYKFLKWVDGDGNSYTDNPLIIHEMTSDKKYTAVFSKSTYTLTLKANPVDGGVVSALESDNVVPMGEGVYAIDSSGTNSRGAVVTIKAEENVQGRTFLYWQNSAGNKFFDKELDLTVISGNDTYTAYFSEGSYPIRVLITPKEVDGKEVGEVDFTYTYNGTEIEDTITSNDSQQGIRNVDPESDITLSAKCKYTEKYKFERWEDSSGRSYTNNPLVVTNVLAAENYIAVFSPRYSAKDYDVTVDISPQAGGKAKLTYDGSPFGNDFKDFKYTYSDIPAGTTFQLIAEAKDGYEFSYWSDSSGAMFQANPLTVADLRADGYYTAVFAKADYTLTLNTNPVDGGVVKAEGAGLAGKGAGVYSVIDGNLPATLTAVPDPGKTFLYWQNSAGDKFFDATLTLSRISGSDTYTAVFSAEHYPVRVILSPKTEDGKQVGQVDVTYKKGGVETVAKVTDDQIINVDPETDVTLSAKTLYTEKYKFERWDDSSGRSYTNNPLIVTNVRAAENFIAVYTPIYSASDYTVTVDMAPEGSGMAKLSPAYQANGQEYGDSFESSKTVYANVPAGSTFQLTAVAKEGYEFSYWSDAKGAVYQANPLTVTNLSSDGYYTAVFNSKNGSSGIKVLASPPSGGKAYEIINDDDTVTLKAEANPGYKFVCWKHNGRKLTDKKTYTAKVDKLIDDEEETYIAYFVIDSSYSVKHDITKYHFYDDKRKVTGPNYLVTRETMISQAKGQIETDKNTMYSADTPSPKEYGAYETARSYYEELSEDKFDPSVLLLEDELYTTDAEVAFTKVADNTFEDVSAGFTKKKFGDRYENEILSTKKVSFEDNEGNLIDMGVRTYIWKDTGAQFKDNVYIIYTSNDKQPQYDYDWVAARVGHDGSLTFTINHLEPGALITAVRVTAH